MKKFFSALLASAMLLSLAACGSGGNSSAGGSDGSGGSSTPQEKTSITFADVGWDSIKLNNALAGLVAEEVFGYTWQETPGSTPISHEALISGDVDVHMEEWTDNIPAYATDLADGKFTELGINFNDNYQGFYIPRYVADQYPDLKTVKDLANYAELFPDPEDSSKGIIYGGITGWSITEIMEKKVHGLRPGRVLQLLCLRQRCGAQRRHDRRLGPGGAHRGLLLGAHLAAGKI